MLLFRLGIGLAVVGGLLVFLGVQEWFAFRTSRAAPEEISLQALIARGPEGNAHIILTNFEMLDDLVYETEGSSTRWNKVWVPVVPRQAPVAEPPGFRPPGFRPPGFQPPGFPEPPKPKPQQVQALIFSIRSPTPEELNRRCDVPKLQALVTNKLVSLGSEERKLLEQSYPGTDFSRCLIIQEGREPPGPTKMLVMCGGGSFLLLIGVGMLGVIGYQTLAGSGSTPKKRKRKRREEDEDVEEVSAVDEEDDPPPARRSRRRRDDDE